MMDDGWMEGTAKRHRREGRMFRSTESDPRLSSYHRLHLAFLTRRPTTPLHSSDPCSGFASCGQFPNLGLCSARRLRNSVDDTMMTVRW